MTYTLYEHPDQKIFLIDMRSEPLYPFSDLLQKGIKKFLAQGKRIGIIANKKGYSAGVICKDCGHVPQCDNCDVPIAYHKDAQSQYFGLCHICKKQYPADAECSQCHSHEIERFGVGTQQVAEWIKDRFGVEAVRVESGQVNSPKKLERFRQSLKGKQVVVGTSLLIQPIAEFPLDLVVVLSADSGLNVPDYQSNWQNFLGLYELFTKHTSPTFLVQTHNPEHRSIVHACNLDLEAMKQEELVYRKDGKYPPFTDMCVILYKHEIEERLFSSTNKLHQELLYLKQQYEMNDLEIYPTPPLIYKIYGKYRYHIILKGTHLRNFMEIVHSKLKLSSRGFKIDWEPMNAV